MTPGGLIRLALKLSGVNGIGQAPADEDVNDALQLLNLMLSEWQLNRWLVPDLVEAYHASTGALSYTVGPGMDFWFTGQRPDKLDMVFVRGITTVIDTPLYPFMSREGWSRLSDKSSQGVPESFFYDPAMGAFGTLYIHPVPSTAYALYAQAKAYLGQFTDLTTQIPLPPAHTTAMVWNLAVQMRPLFQMDPDQAIENRAAATLRAIAGSVAQVPQVPQPRASNRSGVYSGPLAPPEQPR